MQFVKLFLHICTVFFYDYLAICRKKGYEKDMNIDMPTIGNRIKIRRKELIPKHILLDDIIASISYEFNLFFGIGNIDDIDHLGNQN